MTEKSLKLHIRPAELSDRDFILTLVPRFVEFHLPAWRNPDRMTATNQRILATAFDTPPANSAILIAEDRLGDRRGFIHLQTNTDYFSGEAYGYIADIAVSPADERQGVGQALMEAGEAWARQKGYRLLALEVFAQNERACRFYEKLGYREEVRKYVKVLL